MIFKSRKQKTEIEKLRVKSILDDVRAQTTLLSDMLCFIRDYGNVTKRKNKKLKQEDFLRCWNTILNIPLSLCVANVVIKNNKRLKKEYVDLLNQTQTQIEKEIKRLKEKDLINKQLRNNFKGEERNG